MGGAGRPPQALTATKYADDALETPQRTMPLCTYPTQARYKGQGDVKSASSWSCAPNHELLRLGPNGIEAGLVGPHR